MRLIAMSNHSSLKHKEQALEIYQKTISSLLLRIQTVAPEKSNFFVNVDQNQETKNLIILAGSQKGLCGNFNAALFQFFDLERSALDFSTFDLITIGKIAYDFAKDKKIGPIIAHYDDFTTNTLLSISRKTTEKIASAKNLYKKVLVCSNIQKSFFLQKPIMQTLIPLEPEEFEKNSGTATKEEYIWEQSPQELLHILHQYSIETKLHYILFKSLLAEQAARFISMDNSTRNAKSLQEKTKLDYNKLRQAKITKELTELIGSF